MKNSICLYGASGHGKVLKDIAFSQNMNIVVFFDDNPEINILQDVKVLKTNEICDFNDFKFVISIGDNQIRKKISKQLKVKFDILIHKLAVISDSITIKEGTVIMSSVVVNSDSIIGKHCILNTSCVIEHDCVIGDYVHISPNATITGGVTIGDGAHIGAGAVVIPEIKIGKWATIGAGTVIIKDVPDYATVIGNPGKVIKYKEEING